MEEIIQLTLIPLALLIVQAIKTVAPKTSDYAIPIVLFVALSLSVVLVDWSLTWQGATLQLFTFAVMIASGASGVYSWGKKGDTNVELEEYLDEK